MSQFNDDSAKFELELDASQFNRETKKAERSFSSFAAKTTEKISTVRQQFSNYLINDLAGNAIKGAFEKSLDYLSNYADGAAELVKVADAFNMPVEAVSELQAVAKGAELDLRELADAANALNLDALVAPDAPLELDIGEFNGKDKAEQFALVVDGLLAIPDAARRAEAATRLFGDAAASLDGLLASSSGSVGRYIDAAKEAGLIFDDAKARQAAEFSTALTELKESAAGFADMLAGAVLPAFKEGAALATELFAGLRSLSGGFSNATNDAGRFSAAAKSAREEGERLRQLDSGKLDFVLDLAGQGELAQSTFEGASKAVDDLQAKYGDLGLTVDRAAKSITAATDAQEKFNAAAKAKEREEIDSELNAIDAELDALNKQEAAKIAEFESTGAIFRSFARNLAHDLAPETFKSTEEVWSGQIEEIGNRKLELQQRAIDLRKRGAAYLPEKSVPDESNKEKNVATNVVQPDSLNATPLRLEPVRASLMRGFPDGANLPEKSVPDESNEEKNVATNVVQPDSLNATPLRLEPVRASLMRGFPDGVNLPEKSVPDESNEETNVATNVVQPDSLNATPLRLEPVRAANGKPRIDRYADSFDTEKESTADDGVKLPELTQYETRARRATQTREQNEIESIQTEESDFREKVKARLVAERSKGKSKEDAVVVAELTRMLDDSEAREKERVDAIRAELDAKLKEADWTTRPTPAEEKDQAEKEPVAEYRKIDAEAEDYKQLLEAKRAVATTDEDRVQIEQQLARLQVEVDERKKTALEEFNAEKEKSILQEWKDWGFEDDEEDARDQEKYYQDALAASEETAKASAATFNAFDAANLASADSDERMIKGLDRQTRILTDIYQTLHNVKPTFV